jgi:hypothetical protein
VLDFDECLSHLQIDSAVLPACALYSIGSRAYFRTGGIYTNQRWRGRKAAYGRCFEAVCRFDKAGKQQAGEILIG